MSKEYTFPKSINELHKSNLSKNEKGNLFEDFVYQYYLTKFDHVITTRKYDMGIDFICYNNQNLTDRIGIQAKNIKGTVTEKNISNMTNNHKQVYFCNKLILITTGILNRQAEIFCRNNEIEIYDKENVINIIKTLNPITNNNIDYRKELIKIRKELAIEHNINKNYLIYTNQTIDELIRLKPKTKHELIQIKGFGENKIEKYGTKIIEIFKKGE